MHIGRLVVFIFVLFSRFTVFAGNGDLACRSAHGDIDVVILGDSNTSIGGDDCSLPKGWSKWFKERFSPASCRSYARSGATWTNTVRTRRDVTENVGVISDDNVVYNQVNRLADAVAAGTQPSPELILISAGTNDAWYASKRPGAFGKTADEAFAYADGFVTARKVSGVVTLAESVRYACELLMERFPDAQIILLTPLQSASADASLIRKAGDIIEECGHRMGIGVIRLDYLGSVYAVRERVARSRTYDGTHTSEDGARRNGCLIANMVDAMLQF